MKKIILVLSTAVIFLLCSFSPNTGGYVHVVWPLLDSPIVVPLKQQSDLTELTIEIWQDGKLMHTKRAVSTPVVLPSLKLSGMVSIVAWTPNDSHVYKVNTK